MRAADYEETSVVVTSSSGFTLRRVFAPCPRALSVTALACVSMTTASPSSAAPRHLTLPRGRPSKTRRHVHVATVATSSIP